MAAKTGLAQLPKAERKIASSEVSKRTRKLRAEAAAQSLLNTTIALGSTVGAAVVDHKMRKGADSEARFGAFDPAKPNKFRPPVNGVVGASALLLGIYGAMSKKKWAGSALAAGLGFATPAVYTATRDQLAR